MAKKFLEAELERCGFVVLVQPRAIGGNPTYVLNFLVNMLDFA